MTRQIKLNNRPFRISRRAKPIYTVVDEEDFDRLSQWNWTLMLDKKSGLQRASRRIRGEDGKPHAVMMHRQIMNAPYGMEVDHIDGDGLNNTRANLRVVTRTQNLQNRGRFKNNTTGFKGVRKTKEGKWEMQFTAKFDSAEDAAAAYNQCAQAVFGEHARLNDL